MGVNCHHLVGQSRNRIGAVSSGAWLTCYGRGDFFTDNVFSCRAFGGFEELHHGLVVVVLHHHAGGASEASGNQIIRR